MGYNTLATLYYIKKNNLDIKVNIYSPEFDTKLINSLSNFHYPEEFFEFKSIINSLSSNYKYSDDTIKIEIFTGDAREYLNLLSKSEIVFDIVYQDAFSSDVNHVLWTVQYFRDIAKILSKDAILTTYSIATPIRLSIYENKFSIYEYKPNDSNRITIALNKKEIHHNCNFKYIDMELKKTRNTTAKALYD